MQYVTDVCAVWWQYHRPSKTHKHLLYKRGKKEESILNVLPSDALSKVALCDGAFQSLSRGT